jgi:hypothetical protein
MFLSLLAFVTVTQSPAGAESRFTAPISGGSVAVVYMGNPAVSQARIKSVVLWADRSTCTATPLATACDGIMTPGDRVIVGDSYMAWMDLTRDAKGGGGGLLRGVWEMKDSGTASFNFKYLEGSNRAINNLMPCQSLSRCSGFKDSGHELLLSRNAVEVPVENFGAGAESAPVVITDGTYSAANASVTYRFNGQLTQGDGTAAHPYKEQVTPNARMNYNLEYIFYNNTYADPNDPRNQYGIASHASMDVCGAGAGCGGTITGIETVVSSIGVQWVGKNDSTELDAFTPKTEEMKDFAQGCVPGPRTYPKGVREQFTDAEWRPVQTRNASGFGFRFHSPGARTVDFNNSGVSGTYPSTTSRTYQQVLNDGPNQARVFDQKVGDSHQCGAVDTMTPNQDVHFTTTIAFGGAALPPPPTTTTTAPPPPPPPPPAYDDTLSPGESLVVGGVDRLVSANGGHYTAILQGDGHFVLYYHYNQPDAVVLWYSNTQFSGATQAVMQADDGNFVLYRGDGSPVCSTWTNVNPGARMVLQWADGNLVIYAANGTPLWWTQRQDVCHPA